jgi:hypothetical protein
VWHLHWLRSAVRTKKYFLDSSSCCISYYVLLMQVNVTQLITVSILQSISSVRDLHNVVWFSRSSIFIAEMELTCTAPYVALPTPSSSKLSHEPSCMSLVNLSNVNSNSVLRASIGRCCINTSFFSCGDFVAVHRSTMYVMPTYRSMPMEDYYE